MRTIIFFSLFFCSLFSAYGQNIPYGFKKNENTFVNVTVPDSIREKHLLRSTDSTGKMQSPEDKWISYYENEAMVRQEAINLYYYKQQDSINKEMLKAPNSRRLNDLKEQFYKLDKDKENDLKMVKAYKDLAKEMRYRLRTSGNLQAFPVHSSVDAKLFYENELGDKRGNFLKNSHLSYSPDGGTASMFNELYADYASLVRVGIGALISNKQSSNDSIKSTDSVGTQKDAIQRLLGGGGNFVLNLSTPLLNYDNSYLNSERFSFKLIAAPKLSFDVPKLGTEENEYAVNFDAGLEGAIFYTLSESIITVFSNFRFGYIVGNDIFYNNILKTDKKPFVFNNVSLGIALNSTFRINWNYYFGDGFVRKNFPSTIGFSIVPK